MPLTQVNKPKPPKRKPPKLIDPFAPKSDSQIRGESSSLVTQQLGPILAQLAQSIGERGRAGSQAIGDYTGKLQSNLAGLMAPLQQGYAAASQSQAATNDALASRLNNQGATLSGELAGKLGAINAPAAAQTQVAGGAQTQATGAANAGYASGSAELSNLLAQGAHANEYASKLPGIAGLGGQQHMRDLQSNLSQELATKSGEISAQAPGLMAQLYQHLQDQELQKAIAKGSGLSKQAQLDYQQQKAAYDLQLKRDQQAETARHHGATESTAAKNAGTAAQRAANSKAASLRAQRQQNLRQNKWQVNSDGSFKYRLNKQTGKKERIPLKTAKSSSTNSTTGVPNH